MPPIIQHSLTFLFVQEALHLLLRRLRVRVMEQRQMNAYIHQPQSTDELADWLTAQDWGDDWDETVWPYETRGNSLVSSVIT